MAKTIKFNLICDQKPIRTIEDLQNNFSIEDVLTYYRNGLLTRWLEVRGYTEELEAVKAISETDNLKIIKELIKTFEIIADEDETEKILKLLERSKKDNRPLSYYIKEESDKQSIIDNYAVNYQQLINEILGNPNDITLIKANIGEMVTNYAWVLKMHHRELFWTLDKHGCILAIMCLLMNETCREYYLPVKKKADDGSETSDTDHDADNYDEDKKKMYDRICELAGNISKLEKVLNIEGGPKILKRYQLKNTYDSSVVAVEAEHRCMIVKITGAGASFSVRVSPGASFSGDQIAPCGSNDFISSVQTANMFPIYDGIQYRSSNGSHAMWYIEV